MTFGFSTTAEFKLIKQRKSEIVSFPEMSTDFNRETGITYLN